MSKNKEKTLRINIAVVNSFFKEIASLTELPFDTAAAAFRYVNIGGDALYVQGHKGIVSFGEEKIILRVTKARLEVCGGGLKIKQLSNDDIVITGRILSVAMNA